MALDRARLLKPIEKLQTLLKEMGRHPAPDEVHDLRTNIRRFEAIFKALPLDAHGISRSILKNLGRLRKRAGRVRDMDVLMRYAAMVHPKGEKEGAVQLLEHLGVRRRKYAHVLYGEIRGRRPQLRKDLKRSESVLAGLALDTGWNVSATAMKLETELATRRRLGKGSLHPYRIKVRELRNVLQIESDPSRRKLLDALRELKDLIGEWHDWELLITIARKIFRGGEGRRYVAELKRIAKDRYMRALELGEAFRKARLLGSL
jgi:CHAD domain-containing protein